MPKKLTLIGHVKDGILIFPQAQLELRNQWLSSSQTFSVIEILELPKKPKSPHQLGYIFAGIIDFVYNELFQRGWDVGNTGSPWTKEQIRYVLYVQYHIKKGGTRETLSIMKTLSKMDQGETSEFIDFSLQWLAGSPWYVACPDPRPQGERE